MSLATAGVGPADVHHSCVDNPVRGWSVCLTAWHHGLAIAVDSPDRLRVVVVEPSTHDRSATLEPQTRLAAARLLEAGLSSSDSLEALCGLISRQWRWRVPGPSIVLLDLATSGHVEMAGRIAPPVLHVPAQRSPKGISPGDGTTVELDVDDHLLAFSPSFVERAPARALGELPQYVRTSTRPCELRDRLVRTFDDSGPADVTQVPPVALVRRTALPPEPIA